MLKISSNSKSAEEEKIAAILSANFPGGPSANSLRNGNEKRSDGNGLSGSYKTNINNNTTNNNNNNNYVNNNDETSNDCMNSSSDNNNSTIDLNFLQSLSSDIIIGDESRFGQNSSDYLTMPNQEYSCTICQQNFASSKQLQVHNQAAHADKAFVCEICGKAFRFRSNLAEHRSVHTAVKPFVCKYCGKSSRLKGNLTKHILKHHKLEQIDCIGKDDIIIKKGKKSVKDPAAIDFLEKSMIVLQNAAQSTRYASSDLGGGGPNVAWKDFTSSESNGPQREATKLLYVGGLDESTFESVKNSEDPSPEGSCIGTSQVSPMNLGEFHHSQNAQPNSTANDQLLERCKMEIDEEEDPNEDEEDEIASPDETDNGSERRSAEANEDDISARVSNFASVLSEMNGASGGTNALPVFNSHHGQSQCYVGNGGGDGSTSSSRGGVSNNSVALAAAACKALLFGNMAAAVSANAKRSTAVSEDNNANEEDEIRLLGTSKRAGRNSSASNIISNGGTIRSSQCPECGKHLRKPRDLITHMATIHHISPNTAFSTGNFPFSSTASSTHQSATTSAVNELRQLQKLIGDLKNNAQNQSSQVDNNRIQQMVLNLDSRVGRLEKQIEMALNSIYTLVRLQTGINNQVSRFRDETGEQLRNIINILNGKNT